MNHTLTILVLLFTLLAGCTQSYLPPAIANPAANPASAVRRVRVMKRGRAKARPQSCAKRMAGPSCHNVG